MDVALDGADDHFAEDLALGAAAGHFRLQGADGGLHGFAGHHQLGQEGVAAGEFAADVVDADHEALVDGFERVDAQLDGLLCQLLGQLGIAVDDALGHIFEELFVHESLHVDIYDLGFRFMII